MLFIAFGTIQPEMLDAIREAVNLRATFSGEALASPQGDSMRNVSEGTRTRRWNKPLPEEQAASEKWTNTEQKKYYKLKADVEAEWAHALKKSYASGCEFTDRYGERQNVGKHPKFMDEVLHIYMDRHGTKWKTIRH